MEKITNTPTSERPKVSIHEHRVLVSPSKSKKLAAMANKLPVDLSVKSIPVGKLDPVSGLKSELEIELEQARVLIDARINDIMNSFPQGKREKLFGFRFGSVVAIKSLAITAAFKRLDIHNHHLKTRLLESLNYHGDSV